MDKQTQTEQEVSLVSLIILFQYKMLHHPCLFCFFFAFFFFNNVISLSIDLYTVSDLDRKGNTGAAGFLCADVFGPVGAQ